MKTYLIRAPYLMIANPAMTLANKLRIKRTLGQALAELAIFGSLAIFMLGVIVRIGLQYSYQQEAAQETFRRSMDLAYHNQPGGTGASQSLKDHYIPDPSRPFAFGTRQPAVAAGSVVWSDRLLLDSITRHDELPTIEMTTNGVTRSFTTANYLAYISPPTNRSGDYTRKFRRLARMFCSQEADTDDELDDCRVTLRTRRRRIDSDGNIPSATGPIKVVDATTSDYGLNRWTSIIVDRCAGQIMQDPGVCERQCDHFRGIFRRRNGTTRTRRPPLVEPGYCANISMPRTPVIPGDEDYTQVNPEAVNNPHGLELRSGQHGTLQRDTIEAQSPSLQRAIIDRTEGFLGRIMRWQDPDTFELREEDTTTDAYSPGSANAHNYHDTKTETWTTP